MTAKALHSYNTEQLTVYRSALSHWRAMIDKHGASKMHDKYCDMLFEVCNHVERDALYDALGEVGISHCG
jgi:hypothetical protein